MAEFLIYNQDHWMDKLTTAEIAEYTKKYPNFMDKYNARYQRGDIVEVQENGYWIGKRAGWGYPTFVLVQITDMTKTAGMKYMESWNRDVTITRILNDDVNHIYKYKATLNRLSTVHDDELFDSVKDRFDSLPDDITIESKTQTDVIFVLEPLSDPIKRKQEVETAGKRIINEFNKMLRRRRHSILIDNLPQAVKNLLKTQHYASYTKAQVVNYLKDKIN